MEHGYVKLYAAGCSVPLRVRLGHFATNHSHINYYIDMTTLKSRVSEAREAARFLAGRMFFDMPVDTIVCLEGTEMIGGFLAEELTRAGVLSMNAHKTMYVITPEYNSNSQMIFRENILPMMRGKHVILLAASVTTGLSINKGIEAIAYYGGKLTGVAAIFSLLSEINGVRVGSIFGKAELPDYDSCDYRICPLCQQGKKLDALVNAYGYSQVLF